MGENSGLRTVQAVTPMEALCTAIELENQELKGSISVLEKRLQELQWEGDRQEAEYRMQLTQEQDRCKMQIGKAKEQFAALQAKLLDELEAERNKTYRLQKQLSAEQSVVATHHREIGVAQENIKAMQQNLDAERLRADKLRADLKKKQDDISVLKADLKKKQDDISVLKADLKKKQDDISVLKADLKKKQDNISTLEAQIKQLTGQHQQLVVQQEQKTEEAAGLESTVHSLRVDLFNLRSKMKKRTVVLVVLLLAACLACGYFWFQATESQSENRFISQEATDLRKKASKLQEDADSLTEEVKSLQSTNASMETEMQSLQDTCDSLEEQKADLIAQALSLNLNNDYLQNENDTLSERLNTLQADYDKIQPEYEFYHENAVIVYKATPNLYHRYGCTAGSSSNYWIYNTALASNNYSPCSICNRSDSSRYTSFQVW